jgi:CxxC motif-containing protein
MKEMVCIVCPNGCALRVIDCEAGYAVEGAKCKRGEAFALDEMTHPMRSLTTTVATVFEDMPRLPVKTSGEIPKDKLFEAMERINRVLVDHPAHMGEVLLSGLFGVQVVATASLGGIVWNP